MEGCDSESRGRGTAADRFDGGRTLVTPKGFPNPR
jgi:hypothetical protein